MGMDSGWGHRPCFWPLPRFCFKGKVIVSLRMPPLTELLGPPVPLNVISGINAESNKLSLALRPDTDHF